MAISETKMQMVIANYFKDECNVNTSIRQAFEKGFRIGVKKGASTNRPQGEWIESFKRVETRRGAYLGTKFVHDGWSCSECSEVVEKRYPNCPYCLARMKGVSDE